MLAYDPHGSCNLLHQGCLGLYLSGRDIPALCYPFSVKEVVSVCVSISLQCQIMGY